MHTAQCFIASKVRQSTVCLSRWIEGGREADGDEETSATLQSKDAE